LDEKPNVQASGSTEETRQVRRLKTHNWIILGLLTAGSGIWAGPRFSLSVLFGGLLIIANFHVLHGALRRAFGQGASVSATTAVVVLKYYFRLILTGIAVVVLLKFAEADPFGLLLGLSTVVINLLLFAVMEIYRIYY
jgi:hypothetical protein